MSLRDFLLDALGRRSISGWRDVRPTWRDVVGVLVFIVLLGFVAYLVYWSGVENHCLWDNLGAKCENGGN